MIAAMLASRVAERGFGADVREVTECTGFGLIFFRHPPKLVGYLVRSQAGSCFYVLLRERAWLFAPGFVSAL